MRRIPLFWWRQSILMVAIVLGVAGCAMDQSPVVPIAGSGANRASEDDPLAQEAAQHAQEMARLLAERGEGGQQPPTVHWLDLGGRPDPARASAEPQQPIVVVDDADPVVEPSPAARRSREPAATIRSREELLDALLKSVYASDDPALAKAVTAATLAALRPGQAIEPAFLTNLDFRQAEKVRRYHQVVAAFAAEVASGQGRVDRDALRSQLDALFGEQPIRIDTVELCRRVKGFGVYEPFEDHTFLSGREQRMIIYTELTSFRIIAAGDGEHEVKLAQEVVLYNESDGLAVWRQPAVEIVDRCRNQRRDFFVVQMIALPARLSVGKYRLKVRITDMHGGSIDETTLPLQIVADQGLVRGGGR